jgi:primosomal protein N' (replication factor Y)
MSGLSEFAEIAVPVAFHGTLTYRIPDSIRHDVRLGSRVEVPLGPKLTTGFVVGLIDHAPVDASKLKPIRSVLDDEEPALIPDIIELCRWAAEYYIAPLGEMLRVALPANMASRGHREAVLTADDAMIESARRERRILESDLPLLAELKKRPLPVATLFDELKTPRSALDRLRTAGIIAVRDRFKDAEGVRYDRFVVLETDPGGLTAKQQSAVETLQKRGGELSVRAMESAGVSAAVLSALAKKAVVRIERRPRRHTLDAFLSGLEDTPTPEISSSKA